MLDLKVTRLARYSLSSSPTSTYPSPPNKFQRLIRSFRRPFSKPSASEFNVSSDFNASTDSAIPRYSSESCYSTDSLHSSIPRDPAPSSPAASTAATLDSLMEELAALQHDSPFADEDFLPPETLDMRPSSSWEVRDRAPSPCRSAVSVPCTPRPRPVSSVGEMAASSPLVLTMTSKYPTGMEYEAMKTNELILPPHVQSALRHKRRQSVVNRRYLPKIREEKRASFIF